MQIREILTLKSADIHGIAPTDTVESAVAKLVDLGVGSLVVLKHGEMVGLLTERDVLHGMAKRGCDLKDAEVSTLGGAPQPCRWRRTSLLLPVR